MAYPKDCVTDDQKKAYRRAIYLKNPEAARSASRKWRAENPERVKENNRKHRAINGELYNKRQQEKRAANPEKTRAQKVKSQYGLPQEEYEALLLQQNGGCAICGKTSWGIKRKNPHVDHCHATGKVRGLLCSGCNTGLGKLGDTEESLERALAYLKKAR